MPGIVVRFSDSPTRAVARYGPLWAVEFLQNELWRVDLDRETITLLAEYDTQEGLWHVFDASVEHERFTLVTVRCA
jgi:hypothetical protein